MLIACSRKTKESESMSSKSENTGENVGETHAESNSPQSITPTESYRLSMERLEDILENLDNSSIGIDELAASVEEASEHLKRCRSILVRTEEKVKHALEGLEDSLDQQPQAPTPEDESGN